MSRSSSTVSRRAFLSAGAAAAGSLALGCSDRRLLAPSLLHLFRSRSRPTPPRHATQRDLSSRHTHTRVSSASRSLSSCLGNIEVIILMQL